MVVGSVYPVNAKMAGPAISKGKVSLSQAQGDNALAPALVSRSPGDGGGANGIYPSPSQSAGHFSHSHACFRHALGLGTSGPL
jgi:hypothetical protein